MRVVLSRPLREEGEGARLNGRRTRELQWAQTRMTLVNEPENSHGFVMFRRDVGKSGSFARLLSCEGPLRLWSANSKLGGREALFFWGIAWEMRRTQGLADCTVIAQ